MVMAVLVMMGIAVVMVVLVVVVVVVAVAVMVVVAEIVVVMVVMFLVVVVFMMVVCHSSLWFYTVGVSNTVLTKCTICKIQTVICMRLKSLGDENVRRLPERTR